MPTLGFLKKKWTKDLPGGKDPTSPTSPVGDSPVTSTSSGGFPASDNTASSQTSYSQSHSSPAKPKESGQPESQSHQAQTSAPTFAPQNVNLERPISRPVEQSTVETDGANQSQIQGAGAASSNGATMPAIRATKGKYTLSDFTIQRTLGTGSFGRVHLVQSKHNQRYYAVKVLKKQQVVKMKQVEHTNDERKMLQRVKHPFLITLWGTFQDSKNLYMVMDFVEGGELFSLLRKSQVRSSYYRHLQSPRSND